MGGRLVDRAVAGWRWTGGLYDPTVLRTLEAAGYDQSFEYVRDGVASRARHTRAPGCRGILLDRDLRTVFLPPGVGFDPGGIGKGLAADLVVALLMAKGAYGHVRQPRRGRPGGGRAAAGRMANRGRGPPATRRWCWAC